jgi:hypothetical protein
MVEAARRTAALTAEARRGWAYIRLGGGEVSIAID